MTPPPLFRSKTLSFASEAPLICSPNRALTLGADGSSLYGALALSQSDSKDRRRCPVVVPVTLPLVRPPCVASLARPPPLEKTYPVTPVGSLLIGVCRCVPVVTHNDSVAVRRNTLSVVVFLPKKDESLPRCLAGGNGGRVIPQPLDAEASLWPPCCETFRNGSEMSSCFVATTPDVFATEASEA